MPSGRGALRPGRTIRSSPSCKFQCPRGGRGALRHDRTCGVDSAGKWVSMPSGWAGGAAPQRHVHHPCGCLDPFQCPRGGRGALRLMVTTGHSTIAHEFQCPRGGRGALRPWRSVISISCGLRFNALGVGGGRCASFARRQAVSVPTGFNALGVGGGRCAGVLVACLALVWNPFQCPRGGRGALRHDDDDDD